MKVAMPDSLSCPSGNLYNGQPGVGRLSLAVKELLDNLRSLSVNHVKLNMLLELVEYHLKIDLIPIGLQIDVKPLGFKRDENPLLWKEWAEELRNCSRSLMNILKYHYCNEITNVNCLRNAVKRQVMHTIMVEQNCSNDIARSVVDDWIETSVQSGLADMSGLFHDETMNASEEKNSAHRIVKFQDDFSSTISSESLPSRHKQGFTSDHLLKTKITSSCPRRLKEYGSSRPINFDAGSSEAISFNRTKKETYPNDESYLNDESYPNEEGYPNEYSWCLNTVNYANENSTYKKIKNTTFQDYVTLEDCYKTDYKCYSSNINEDYGLPPEKPKLENNYVMNRAPLKSKINDIPLCPRQNLEESSLLYNKDDPTYANLQSFNYRCPQFSSIAETRKRFNQSSEIMSNNPDPSGNTRGQSRMNVTINVPACPGSDKKEDNLISSLKANILKDQTEINITQNSNPPSKQDITINVLNEKCRATSGAAEHQVTHQHETSPYTEQDQPKKAINENEVRLMIKSELESILSKTRTKSDETVSEYRRSSLGQSKPLSESLKYVEHRPKTKESYHKSDEISKIRQQILELQKKIAAQELEKISIHHAVTPLKFASKDRQFIERKTNRGISITKPKKDPAFINKKHGSESSSIDSEDDSNFAEHALDKDEIKAATLLNRPKNVSLKQKGDDTMSSDTFAIYEKLTSSNETLQPDFSMNDVPIQAKTKANEKDYNANKKSCLKSIDNNNNEMEYSSKYSEHPSMKTQSVKKSDFDRGVFDSTDAKYDYKTNSIISLKSPTSERSSETFSTPVSESPRRLEIKKTSSSFKTFDSLNEDLLTNAHIVECKYVDPNTPQDSQSQREASYIMNLSSSDSLFGGNKPMFSKDEKEAFKQSQRSTGSETHSDVTSDSARKMASKRSSSDLFKFDDKENPLKTRLLSFSSESSSEPNKSPIEKKSNVTSDSARRLASKRSSSDFFKLDDKETPSKTQVVSLSSESLEKKSNVTSDSARRLASKRSSSDFFKLDDKETPSKTQVVSLSSESLEKKSNVTSDSARRLASKRSSSDFFKLDDKETPSKTQVISLSSESLEKKSNVTSDSARKLASKRKSSDFFKLDDKETPSKTQVDSFSSESLEKKSNVTSDSAQRLASKRSSSDFFKLDDKETPSKTQVDSFSSESLEKKSNVTSDSARKLASKRKSSDFFKLDDKETPSKTQVDSFSSESLEKKSNVTSDSARRLASKRSSSDFFKLDDKETPSKTQVDSFSSESLEKKSNVTSDSAQRLASKRSSSDFFKLDDKETPSKTQVDSFSSESLEKKSNVTSDSARRLASKRKSSDFFKLDDKETPSKTQVVSLSSESLEKKSNVTSDSARRLASKRKSSDFFKLDDKETPSITQVVSLSSESLEKKSNVTSDSARRLASKRKSSDFFKLDDKETPSITQVVSLSSESLEKKSNVTSDSARRLASKRKSSDFFKLDDKETPSKTEVDSLSTQSSAESHASLATGINIIGTNDSTQRLASKKNSSDVFQVNNKEGSFRKSSLKKKTSDKNSSSQNARVEFEDDNRIAVVKNFSVETTDSSESTSLKTNSSKGILVNENGVTPSKIPRSNSLNTGQKSSDISFSSQKAKESSINKTTKKNDAMKIEKESLTKKNKNDDIFSNIFTMIDEQEKGQTKTSSEDDVISSFDFAKSVSSKDVDMNEDDDQEPKQTKRESIRSSVSELLSIKSSDSLRKYEIKRSLSDSPTLLRRRSSSKQKRSSDFDALRKDKGQKKDTTSSNRFNANDSDDSYKSSNTSITEKISSIESPSLSMMSTSSIKGKKQKQEGLSTNTETEWKPNILKQKLPPLPGLGSSSAKEITPLNKLNLDNTIKHFPFNTGNKLSSKNELSSKNRSSIDVEDVENGILDESESTQQKKRSATIFNLNANIINKSKDETLEDEINSLKAETTFSNTKDDISNKSERKIDSLPDSSLFHSIKSNMPSKEEKQNVPDIFKATSDSDSEPESDIDLDVNLEDPPNTKKPSRHRKQSLSFDDMLDAILDSDDLSSSSGNKPTPSGHAPALVTNATDELLNDTMIQNKVSIGNSNGEPESSYMDRSDMETHNISAQLGSDEDLYDLEDFSQFVQNIHNKTQKGGLLPDAPYHESSNSSFRKSLSNPLPSVVEKSNESISELDYKKQTSSEIFSYTKEGVESETTSSVDLLSTASADSLSKFSWKRFSTTSASMAKSAAIEANAMSGKTKTNTTNSTQNKQEDKKQSSKEELSRNSASSSKNVEEKKENQLEGLEMIE